MNPLILAQVLSRLDIRLYTAVAPHTRLNALLHTTQFVLIIFVHVPSIVNVFSPHTTVIHVQRIKSHHTVVEPIVSAHVYPVKSIHAFSPVVLYETASLQAENFTFGCLTLPHENVRVPVEPEYVQFITAVVYVTVAFVLVDILYIVALLPVNSIVELPKLRVRVLEFVDPNVCTFML